MQCPNCQTEVAEWHFYCPQCRTQVVHYNSDTFARRTMVQRAGANFVNFLLILLFIGGSFLIARSIKWNDLINLFKDPAESIPTLKSKRLKRSANHSSNPKETLSSAGAQNDRLDQTPIANESVRATSQKIEELPSPDDLQDQQPAPSAVLGVQQFDAGQAVLNIDSYAPAKIYVNGQFSGNTPRAIRLNAGEYLIKLSADGYEDYSRKVKLKAQQQIGILAPMQRMQKKTLNTRK